MAGCIFLGKPLIVVQFMVYLFKETISGRLGLCLSILSDVQIFEEII